jgi:hypothetical protein
LSGTRNGIGEFLNYEREKLKYIAQLESKRLDDLKDARATIFKYALPTTIIDAVAGGLGTYFTGNALILLPTALFVILIYFLADGLDRKKYAERMDIIHQTSSALYAIDLREVELLRIS